MEKLQVAYLGYYVRNQLITCPKGKVLAVFSNIIYLLDDNDEISWISSRQFPKHRRSIQIFGSIPKIEVGSKYFFDSQNIFIDPSFQFSLAEATIWEVPRFDPNNRQEIPILQDDFQKVFRIFADLPQPKGFGLFLRKLIWQSTEDFSVVLLDEKNTLEVRFFSVISKLISACKQSDFKQFRKEAVNIIGLGQGLTPSGDDFYGGLFFCLKFANEYSSDKLEFFGQTNVDQLKGMTNYISYAIMSDMVKGHGIEPLHQLLKTIFLGEGDEREIKEYSTQLLSVGNSTGWDILTGVVTGLLVYKIIKRKQPQVIEFEEILI